MEINTFASTLKIFLFAFVHKLPRNISSASELGCEGIPSDEDDPRFARITYDDISAYQSLFLSRGVTSYPAITMAKHVVLRLELEDSEDLDKARRKIKEAELMETRMKELRRKLRKESEFKVPLKNDAWLLRFLRARDYDIPLTYDLIQNYYRFKQENRTELYAGLLPSTEKDMFLQDFITVLPVRDQDKRRLLLIRVGNWHPSEYPFIRIFKILILLLELGVYEPAIQLAHVQVIFDLQGLARKHITGINYQLAQKMKHWTLNCIPFHIEGVHVVNPGFFFGMAYRAVKVFIPQEMQDKIKVHYKLQSFHKEIPATLLPDIYSAKGVASYSIDSAHILEAEWNVLLAFQDQEYKALDKNYGLRRTVSNVSEYSDISESVVTPQRTSVEVY